MNERGGGKRDSHREMRNTVTRLEKPEKLVHARTWPLAAFDAQGNRPPRLRFRF